MSTEVPPAAPTPARQYMQLADELLGDITKTPLLDRENYELITGRAACAQVAALLAIAELLERIDLALDALREELVDRMPT